MGGDSAVGRIRFDDVEVDLDGHRLRVHGADVPLEPKAFAVLSLLVRHPGRVLTRDQILDAVWGHAHVTPSVLNRIVTLLRQALGESAGAYRYLHTVHGVGYRFDLPEPADPASAPPALDPQAERADAQPRMRLASLRSVSWLLPLAALLAFAGWQWWSRGSSASPPPAASEAVTERSIAVLPLANASSDESQQFFSDGLSESLINALSHFDGLKVIGRDSAFQFRDSQDDSRSIGRQLGVAYLLGGSVQHVGSVVRINATLTRAADGSTLWAEHYDRPYKNLFALQDEIATAVANALQAKLAPANGVGKHDDRPPSGNLVAYTAYLQGLKHWHEENFTEAAGYMDKAVQIDPGYAIAWAHLSGSWSTLAAFGDPPVVAREHMDGARRAADTALQLAPGLGAAHAARAYLDVYGFDHQGALAECRRAVQLAPEDGTVLNGCGYVLAQVGKLGEAIRARRHLLSIEPLYIVNYQQYARLLLATGRMEEAGKYLRVAENLPRTNPYWYSSTASLDVTAAVMRGDADAAMSIAVQMPAENRGLYTALATQIGPDRTAADAALAKVLANRVEADAFPYLVAQIYALRDDADHAVQWLQRASTGDLLFLPTDPLILNLRHDPRFIAFCEKTGLPSPAESEALSIDQIRALSSPSRH